jgi:hypothetical protein
MKDSIYDVKGGQSTDKKIDKHVTHWFLYLFNHDGDFLDDK